MFCFGLVRHPKTSYQGVQVTRYQVCCTHINDIFDWSVFLRPSSCATTPFCSDGVVDILTHLRTSMPVLFCEVSRNIYSNVQKQCRLSWYDLISSQHSDHFCRWLLTPTGLTVQIPVFPRFDGAGFSIKYSVVAVVDGRNCFDAFVAKYEILVFFRSVRVSRVFEENDVFKIL